MSFSVFVWLSLEAPRSSVAFGAGLEPGVRREIGTVSRPSRTTA
jgi:hypothetical protein